MEKETVIVSQELILAAAQEWGYVITKNGNLEKLPVSVSYASFKKFNEIRNQLIVVLEGSIAKLDRTLLSCVDKDPASVRKITDAFTKKTAELYQKFSSDVEGWANYLQIPCKLEYLNPFDVDPTIPIMDQPIQDSCVN